jgi:ribonuclease H / adenosylcobalamin/alpha-ribazole phosphatase
MSVDRVVVEADGGARGNPGPAGYGAVVRDAGSGEVLAERSESLGVATNNVAEYSGLIAGLRAAEALGAREVDVRMDSKLVVEQMSGRWQIKHPGLRPLAAEAAALVRQFDAVRFGWIPRERNKHADALANRAMDEAAGRRPKAAAEPAPAAPGSAGPAAATGAAPPAAGPAAPAFSWEPRLEVPTRLVLVRHGETELTAQRRYSGRGDVPLSDRGQAQARATAARVAALAGPVAAVVSSPLSRCTGTAAPIADAVGAGVRVEPDLIECDFGEWEGHTFAEVREGWPAQVAAWLDSPAVAPPGGESFRAVQARTRRAVARLRDGYPGQTVVVVSHVSPIKLLLRDALAARDAFLHRLFLSPAGLSIVDSWPDGGVAVQAVNDTAHLTAPVSR